MADIDKDLLTALKQAKTKKMFFAFVPKGSDGKLLVSKVKIPAKEIAETKKEIGGGAPVLGKCIGEGGAMVFYVAKQAPPAMAAALKKVVKRDTALTIDPDFRVAGDAEADEPDTGETAPATATPTTSAAAPPAAPPPNAPAPPKDGQTAAPNLGPWQKARQTAIADLKALAMKVAATKHADAKGVLMEINSIMTKLPAAPAPKDIDKLEDFIRHDDAITAAEEVPDHFHKLEIRKPLLEALESLKH